ncbi:MAG: enoyl-CoA hydratase-related protein, partial [Solirubrobacterales bacterium]
MSERTTYEVDEKGIGLIRLDRPEARNAMDTLMLEELLAHLESARSDDDLRVLIVSSTDHMSLSAGADVREELDR